MTTILLSAWLLVVERSYNHQINAIIARHMPSLAEAVTRIFVLGEASVLRSLFAKVRLGDIETHTVGYTFVLPSFDAYYGPAVGPPLARHLLHCRRRFAAPCVRKCGATSPTVAGLSRQRRSIGSPVREGIEMYWWADPVRGTGGTADDGLFRPISRATERFATMNIRHTPTSVAAPFGPYSHAVEVPEGSRLLYISGEVGVLPDGTVPETIEAQAEACWRNIIAILADAGMGIEDLVKITTYLVRSEDVVAAGAARAKHFGDARPGSATIIVKALVNPALLIEIEAVAAGAARPR